MPGQTIYHTTEMSDINQAAVLYAFHVYSATEPGVIVTLACRDKICLG